MTDHPSHPGESALDRIRREHNDWQRRYLNRNIAGVIAVQVVLLIATPVLGPTCGIAAIMWLLFGGMLILFFQDMKPTEHDDDRP